MRGYNMSMFAFLTARGRRHFYELYGDMCLFLNSAFSKSMRVAYGRMFCSSFVPSSNDRTTSIAFTSTGSCKQARVFVTQVKPVNTQDSDSYGFRDRRANTM